ncbi:hypothetical protein K438DRAFT_1985218 [Mycena galopus ATCC 62051]|nr:hypothetical protein K438DRAFT_1985218 [Mycena galopus ATCC 62051]
MSSTPAPPDAAKSPARSSHAEAQAKYRLKHVEAERDKARERMPHIHVRLREKRKNQNHAQSPERNSRGETYEKFIARSRADLFASQEFQEFREYCDKVMVDRVYCKNLQEVADFEVFLSRNPCVEDLGPNGDWYIEHLWDHREDRFPEWREELADFRDVVAEHTPEELDRMQLEVRSHQRDRYIIRARGGF